MTGKHGSLHTRGSLDYGTKVVGGINANKAGTMHLGLPVFGSVADGMKQTGAIISGGKGDAKSKIAALEANGITVVNNPSKMGEAMARVLAERASGRQ